MSLRSYVCETCGKTFVNGNLARAHARENVGHTFTEHQRGHGKNPNAQTSGLTLTDEEFRSRAAQFEQAMKEAQPQQQPPWTHRQGHRRK